MIGAHMFDNLDDFEYPTHSSNATKLETLIIPATIKYVDPLHWKIADIISIAGFFAFIFKIYCERKRQIS